MQNGTRNWWFRKFWIYPDCKNIIIGRFIVKKDVLGKKKKKSKICWITFNLYTSKRVLKSKSMQVHKMSFEEIKNMTYRPSQPFKQKPKSWWHYPWRNFLSNWVNPREIHRRPTHFWEIDKSTVRVRNCNTSLSVIDIYSRQKIINIEIYWTAPLINWIWWTFIEFFHPKQRNIHSP